MEELANPHYPADTPLVEIVDRAPCCIHQDWPVERAHRLFATLGLRHLIVMDAELVAPVGMITRHDLQHHHWRPRNPTRSTNTTTISRLTQSRASLSGMGYDGDSPRDAANGNMPFPTASCGRRTLSSIGGSMSGSEAAFQGGEPASDCDDKHAPLLPVSSSGV